MSNSAIPFSSDVFALLAKYNGTNLVNISRDCEAHGSHNGLRMIADGLRLLEESVIGRVPSKSKLNQPTTNSKNAEQNSVVDKKSDRTKQNLTPSIKALEAFLHNKESFRTTADIVTFVSKSLGNIKVHYKDSRNRVIKKIINTISRLDTTKATDVANDLLSVVEQSTNFTTTWANIIKKKPTNE